MVSVINLKYSAHLFGLLLSGVLQSVLILWKWSKEVYASDALVLFTTQAKPK